MTYSMKCPHPAGVVTNRIVAGSCLAMLLGACGEGTLPPPVGAGAGGSDSAASAQDPDVDPADSQGMPDEETGGDANQEPEQVVVPDCEMPGTIAGSIDSASPLISVGLNVTASDGVQNPELVVDGRYHVGGGAIMGLPTADEPAQIAIEVGEGPSRLLLMWSDVSFNNYNAPLSGSPLDYRIEVSADSSDGVDGEWTQVVSVEDNPVRTRAHSFDFEGQNWVRFVVTAGQEGARNVVIDEIALHDVSAAGDGRPLDTWFFMGDSITMAAFNRSYTDDNFDLQVGELHDGYTPVVIDGGIGGELASNGIAHLSEWLDLNPDFEHIVLAYGTNDAWNNFNVEATAFEDNLRQLIQGVLDADRVPVLARIPYATASSHTAVPDYNAVIQTLTEEFDLPCGADLYSFFQANPEQLSAADGIHPSPEGYASMNRIWADAVADFYPE